MPLFLPAGRPAFALPPSRRGRPGRGVRLFPRHFSDSGALESGPDTFDQSALQRMQTSRRGLRKRSRLSIPEMIRFI